MCDEYCVDGNKYGVSHKSGVMGELCYLEKYGKFKEGKVAENLVFRISSVGNFLPRTSR
jgi:hypothetical protein